MKLFQIELFIAARVKKVLGLPFGKVERKIVIMILWWSEMPVSKAVDLIKRFGMFVIILSIFVGYPSCGKLVSWWAVLIGKTHKKFVIESYARLYSNHQAKHNFSTKCYGK